MSKPIMRQGAKPSRSRGDTMAISKVVYGAETLVDLTGDTVTPDDVAEGVTFHGADGVKRSGTRSNMPAAHADTHATGGSDPISPASIGAQAVPIRREYSGSSPEFTLALEDNTEYILPSVVSHLYSLTLTFPDGPFDCWLRFTISELASLSRAPDPMPLQVNFPSTATFLGGVPTFEPGKTYEMSIKNGCVICAEVVSA